MKYLMLVALVFAPLSVMGAIECDKPQNDWYNNPTFNYYMNSTDIKVQSDNNFNGDVWYDYGTWAAQFDWEARTKLTVQRGSGNTVINITVSDLGTTGWYGLAWSENQGNILLTQPTNPQSTCNIDLNTHYMDGLIANSEFVKFRAILTHEIGHCLGLAHHGLLNELMNASACQYNNGPSCVVSQDACYTVDNVIF